MKKTALILSIVFCASAFAMADTVKITTSTTEATKKIVKHVNMKHVVKKTAPVKKVETTTTPEAKVAPVAPTMVGTPAAAPVVETSVSSAPATAPIAPAPVVPATSAM